MGININPTNATALAATPGLSYVALAPFEGGATNPSTAAATAVTPVDTAANEAFMNKWSGVEAMMAANGLEPAALQNQTSLSAAATTLAKYQQALDSNARTGQDAQAVATALVSSMQQLILQRPDLANAKFDFQSDNGAIKVTSGTLSDSDRAWLQNLLNSNGSLVHAVQSFHNDLVGDIRPGQMPTAKTPVGNFYKAEKFNIFEQNLSNSWAIRIPFFPSDATSLGMHETA